jgi:hypothetical protein
MCSLSPPSLVIWPVDSPCVPTSFVLSPWVWSFLISPRPLNSVLRQTRLFQAPSPLRSCSLVGHLQVPSVLWQSAWTPVKLCYSHVAIAWKPTETEPQAPYQAYWVRTCTLRRPLGPLEVFDCGSSREVFWATEATHLWWHGLALPWGYFHIWVVLWTVSSWSQDQDPCQELVGVTASVLGLRQRTRTKTVEGRVSPLLSPGQNHEPLPKE